MSGVELTALRAERAALLLTGLAYLGAALLAVTLSPPPSHIATIWLANALVLGMMLRRPQVAVAYLVIAGLAPLIVGFLLRDPAVLIIGTAIINVAEGKNESVPLQSRHRAAPNKRKSE